MSPTIVTPTSHDTTSLQASQNSELDQKGAREIGGYKNSSPGKTPSLESHPGLQEKTGEETGERSRSAKICGHFNKSQGCLDEISRGHCEGSNERSKHRRGEKNMSRRSTSDLTDMADAETEITLLSSPRRRGSMKGGLGESFLFFMN